MAEEISPDSVRAALERLGKHWEEMTETPGVPEAVMVGAGPEHQQDVREGFDRLRTSLGLGDDAELALREGMARIEAPDIKPEISFYMGGLIGFVLALMALEAQAFQDTES